MKETIYRYRRKRQKGYRQKGKYNNKGKHLGWYKNGKISGEHVDITNYLNDVSNPLAQVMMTSDSDGNFNAAYTYGLERIEVEALDNTRPESQDPLYYLYDGLGSVAYMVKPDGNTRDQYNYDEYGKPAPGNSKLLPDGAINLHNTFGYTGEMWDEESKLLYLRARYYEPETGRFLSRDTYEGELGNPLSKNLYSYVQNNPVNFTDPTGHQRQKCILDAINYNHAIIVKLGGQFNKTKDPTMKALLNIQADELRIQNLQMLYWTSSSETEQTKLQSQITRIRRDHGWGWPDTQYFTPDGPGIKFGNHRVTKKEVAKWRTSITKGTGQVKKPSTTTTTVRSNPPTATTSNWDALKKGVSGLTDIPDIVSSGVKQTWNDPNTKWALKQTGIAVVTNTGGAGVIRVGKTISGPVIQSGISVVVSAIQDDWSTTGSRAISPSTASTFQPIIDDILKRFK